MTNNISALLSGSSMLQTSMLGWFADLYLKSLLILAIVFCLQLLLWRWSASNRSSLWKLSFTVLVLLPLIKLMFPGLAFAVEVDPAIYASGLRLLESELAMLGGLMTYLGIARIDVLGIAYLSISTLLTTYLLCGLIRTWHISRTATPIRSTTLQARVQDLKDVNGSGQAIELLRSDAVSSPLAWGMLNNRIVFPSAFLSWDESVVHQVLHHEFGHILRRDWTWQMLARVTCYLYWLNPLVWMAHRCLVLESEKASDDFVTEEASSPIPYAETMLWVARSLTGRERSTAVAVLSSQSQLRARIAHILDEKKSHAINRNSLLPALVMSVLFCFSLSPLRLGVKEAEVEISLATPPLLYQVNFFQKGSAEFSAFMSEKARYAIQGN